MSCHYCGDEPLKTVYR